MQVLTTADYTELGKGLFAAGQSSDALQAINAGLSLNPNDTAARALRGEVLYKVGAYRAAAADFKYVLQTSAKPPFSVARRLRRAEARVA